MDIFSHIIYFFASHNKITGYHESVEKDQISFFHTTRICSGQTQIGKMETLHAC